MPISDTRKCGAKTRKGEPCQQPAMPNGRCRLHGGKSLRGVASGTFKSGRYSQDLLTNLQPHYYEELTDPKLVELQDEIAAARAYIKEIMRLGESGKRWSDVETAFWEMDAAIKEGSSGDLRVAMERMLKIVRQGKNDWAHRDEIMRRFEGVRRLVDSERKHRIDSRLAVTHEQMATTLAAYVDIVRRHVDCSQLRSISADLEALIRDAERGPDELTETN